MALYHKYRPKKFSEIIGQEIIAQTLQNQIINNKINHAYLFSGSRGVGKTTTARILAKSLNCPNRQNNSAEPCNKCSTCQEIDNSQSIDVIEIDAASHTKVEQVRQFIIESAQFKPTKSKYKIFIIDEVHMLSNASFNALLKTIEEPPEHVIFILATTEPQKVLPTIISRCQWFNFQKVNNNKLKNYLQSILKQEKVKIADEVIDKIIHKSDGCVRDAIKFLDQLIATGLKEIKPEDIQAILPSSNFNQQLEFINLLLKNELSTAFKFINELYNNGQNLEQFAKDLISNLRYILIYKSNPDLAQTELDLDEEQTNKIIELANLTNLNELLFLIDLSQKRLSEIKDNLIKQLPLELLITEWRLKKTNNKPEINNNSVNNDKNKIQEKQQKQNNNEKQIKQTDNSKENNVNSIKTQTEQTITNKTITKDDLNKIWPNFLEELEKTSPSLIFILKNINFEINNNNLTFFVPYKIHQDKLSELNTKNKILEIFKKLLNIKLNLDIQLSTKQQQKTTDDDLTEIANLIGGELISN